MTRPVRAKPFTQMRRGRLPARSCGHDRTIVDRPDRPSGRNASPSGLTPSTIMSPARSRHGSWTEIRLGARAHPTRTSNRAHAPPPPSGSIRRSRTDSTCDQVPAQIRSVAAPPVSRVRRASSIGTERMWTRVMIVLGADTHQRSHTIAAINAATGQLLGDKTVLGRSAVGVGACRGHDHQDADEDEQDRVGDPFHRQDEPVVASDAAEGVDHLPGREQVRGPPAAGVPERVGGAPRPRGERAPARRSREDARGSAGGLAGGRRLGRLRRGGRPRAGRGRGGRQRRTTPRAVFARVSGRAILHRGRSRLLHPTPPISQAASIAW